MKITNITIDRNFHISNNDRFLMEKVSINAEVNEEEGVYYAIDTARKIIETNFKAAYPKIYVGLNFDETIQINPAYAHHLSSYTSRADLDKMETKIAPSEEKIDNSFNLIEEINKCKNITMLSVYKVMCKTQEELSVYNEKHNQLKAEEINSIIEKTEALTDIGTKQYKKAFKNK